ncbi:hypothetical protein [Saccharothrix syringae]|uniref:hypothetical protein n=1 Tax=Saccharothrix syringae TaxID=103733 RepID=UPI000A459A25|nr:hypothetical protein [Saccharothrix syringae]
MTPARLLRPPHRPGAVVVRLGAGGGALTGCTDAVGRAREFRARPPFLRFPG